MRNFRLISLEILCSFFSTLHEAECVVLSCEKNMIFLYNSRCRWTIFGAIVEAAQEDIQ